MFFRAWQSEMKLYQLLSKIRAHIAQDMNAAPLVTYTQKFHILCHFFLSIWNK
jgi:hypothetical protein